MEYLISVTLKPPVLDGTNYAYWKPKMRMYIKSIEEHAWRSILTGWEPPKTSTDEDNEVTLKRELDWTSDEITTTSFNSKALNTIFATVDISMFKIISNCISTKDVWDRLQEHCEGSENLFLENLV
ncbi:hypothetical protein ACS0TY_017808 [Phlomoides rotata]